MKHALPMALGLAAAAWLAASGPAYLAFAGMQLAPRPPELEERRRRVARV